MLRIDQYAYSNRLKNVHPLEKFVLAVALLVLCLLANSLYLSGLILALMAGAIVGLARIPWRYFLKLLLIPSAFLLVGVLTIAFSVGGDPASYQGVALTLGGVVLGVHFQDLAVAGNVFFKSLGAVSCLYFLALTTPLVDLIWVLKKLKVPALFLEIMGLMYRFIFILLDTAAQIRISQSARLGYASLKSSYFSLGALVANLFGKSYQRSRELTVALMSRCYTDAFNVLENQYDLSLKNWAFIALVIGALALLTLYWEGGQAWLI